MEPRQPLWMLQDQYATVQDCAETITSLTTEMAMIAKVLNDKAPGVYAKEALLQLQAIICCAQQTRRLIAERQLNQHGLTRSEISAASGVSTATLQNWWKHPFTETEK